MQIMTRKNQNEYKKCTNIKEYKKNYYKNAIAWFIELSKKWAATPTAAAVDCNAASTGSVHCTATISLSLATNHHHRIDLNFGG